MGTRHFIAVQLDGQYKIAQYGQWDGNPAGQGVTALGFIRDLSLDNYAIFHDKVRATKMMTKEDLQGFQKRIDAGEFPNGWQRDMPQLSRDTGADILDMVLDGPAGIELKNSVSFPADSAFCEWAYVIDLDTRTFEVFKGFNKEPLSVGERFHRWGEKYPEEDVPKGFHPVRFVRSWPLDALPSDEDFKQTLEPREEDEEVDETA